MPESLTTYIQLTEYENRRSPNKIIPNDHAPTPLFRKDTIMKLAEALLRRKELQDKVSRIAVIKEKDIFEVKTVRKAVHEGIDDIIAQVPKLTLAEVTKEYDHYAKRLRLIDAAIQQANWTTDIEVGPSVNQDFTEEK